MLNIEYTNKFKRDLKLAKRQNLALESLNKIMKKIADLIALEAKYRDHALTGNWQHHRELPINPDWLLIYRLIPRENTVIFIRTGSHSELFK